MHRRGRVGGFSVWSGGGAMRWACGDVTTVLCCHANSCAVGFALQSVEKSTFQYVRMSVCPENLGKWSTPPRNESELWPKSIQSCFPLLQGPRCRKSPSALFRSKWVQYDCSRLSDRKKTFFSIRWGIVIVLDPLGSKKC